MINPLNWFKKRKEKYHLMWSPDFKAYQIYLRTDSGSSYFKGWATTKETNFDDLLEHEIRLGGNLRRIFR